MNVSELFKKQNKIKYAVIGYYNLDPVKIYRTEDDGVYYYIDNTGQHVYLFGDEQVTRYTHKKGE